MSNELCVLFKKNKVVPYKIPCQRIINSPVEFIYVVACYRDNLLIYDDVEEEFGIGVVPKGGVLKEWNLYGSLEVALNALSESDKA